MEHIGKGEGNQVYGHGLYFADSQDVAQSYKEVLTHNAGTGFNSRIDGQGRKLADDLLTAHGGDKTAAVRAAKALRDQPGGATVEDRLINQRVAQLALNKIEPQGRLYEVRINAEPEQFLDWDKPLSEQPQAFKTLLSPGADMGLSLQQVMETQGQRIMHADDLSYSDANKKLVSILQRNGIPGIRYKDAMSRGGDEGTYNYVVFDDQLIEIVAKDGVPVARPEETGGALFSLREDARAQLKADLDEADAIADAKAKAQRERQALIDEGVRQRNEGFVTTLRDARGQINPGLALMNLIETHGEVELPRGMASVAGEAKAIEAMAKAEMEELLHTFRPQLGTGRVRERARLTNMVRELAGEGTGDTAAQGLGQGWLGVAERLRQEFNAAGGDIPKLEGWFLPQVHDRAALLAVGPARWIADQMRLLDVDRTIATINRFRDGAPLDRAGLQQVLRDSYENITSDGHGTLGANASDPFGGVTGQGGGRKLANRRQEHRFFHYKNADAWLEYQAAYGGGSDPFAAMMSHITGMSKDIAALRVLGTNPTRELARLSRFVLKQAAMVRPAAVIIDEATARVKALNEALLAAPDRANEIADRVGAIHKDLDAIRRKRVGQPSHRSKKKIDALRQELFALERERAAIEAAGPLRSQGIEAAKVQAELDNAYADLDAAHDADAGLFPRRTEMLGKPLTHEGRWSTNPDDYARSYVKRAEAMWDLYTGATSAPDNVKWARRMQTLRNLGVIGRGGSMVISSVTDNFSQVMARKFAGLPLASTMTDITKQFGPTARREAHRQALIGETYLHMYNDGARHAASLQGAEWSNYLAERTIALQGLGRLTDAQRQGFGMSIQASLASLADKSWDQLGALNADLQRVFRRYGLDQADWDAVRLDPATGKPRQVDFLSPNLVRDSLEAAGRGDERVAERYLGMILQETDFASPTAMLRARAMMVGKTRPGSLVGELLRIGGQFKSFAIMFWMLHVERALREGISSGTLRGGAYAGQVLAATTLGGALVVQLKALKSGQDPQPMDTEGFWMRALTQGGGVGIWGDLWAAETNRFGGGVVSTFGGPVVGLAEQAIAPLTTFAKKETPTPEREAARLLTGYVPGSSLWYTTLAWRRLVADQLQKLVDPLAYDAFRRAEQRQMKDYGNRFFWRPGETAPERGPRFSQ